MVTLGSLRSRSKAYSPIEQDDQVNKEGKLLGELFIDFITVNDDYFDILVKLISEKIKLDHTISSKLLHCHGFPC